MVDERFIEYEERLCYDLMKRTPIIIRIDGWGFLSDFMADLGKPYDTLVATAFERTAQKVYCAISGVTFCFLSATNAEITFLLTDYGVVDTNGGGQRLASLAAALTTREFNNIFAAVVEEKERDKKPKLWHTAPENILREKTGKALFQAKAFNIPESAIEAYFAWRQTATTCRSIDVLYKMLHGGEEDISLKYPFLSGLFGMPIEEKRKACQKEWENIPANFRYGSCIYNGGQILLTRMPSLSKEPGFIMSKI